MWRRLGIGQVMTSLLAGSRRDVLTERVLFALVANRALAASSKLAAASWISRRVHLGGLPEVSDDACYQAGSVALSGIMIEQTWAVTVTCRPRPCL